MESDSIVESQCRLGLKMNRWYSNLLKFVEICRVCHDKSTSADAKCTVLILNDRISWFAVKKEEFINLLALLRRTSYILFEVAFYIYVKGMFVAVSANVKRRQEEVAAMGSWLRGRSILSRYFSVSAWRISDISWYSVRLDDVDRETRCSVRLVVLFPDLFCFCAYLCPILKYHVFSAF